jgi:hypothetical protein
MFKTKKLHIQNKSDLEKALSTIETWANVIDSGVELLPLDEHNTPLDSPNALYFSLRNINDESELVVFKRVGETIQEICSFRSPGGILHIDTWYTRSETHPATPTGDVPDAPWFDVPPASDGNPLWMSTADKDGDNHLIGDWSDPVKTTGDAGNQWVLVFKRSENQPTTPTENGTPHDWFANPPERDADNFPMWMSKSIQTWDFILTDVWSDPVRWDGLDGADGMDGIDGIDGSNIEMSYSALQNGTFDSTFDIATDKWAKVKVGDTWSSAYLMVATNGSTGPTGPQGPTGPSGGLTQQAFFSQPSGPYKVGDIWFNGSVMYVSGHNRETGFSAGEWDIYYLYAKYIDAGTEITSPIFRTTSGAGEYITMTGGTYSAPTQMAFYADNVKCASIGPENYASELYLRVVDGNAIRIDSNSISLGGALVIQDGDIDIYGMNVHINDSNIPGVFTVNGTVHASGTGTFSTITADEAGATSSLEHLEVGHGLDVTGAVTVSTTLHTDGAATLASVDCEGTLHSGGAATLASVGCEGTLHTDGAATFDGDVTMNAAVNFGKSSEVTFGDHVNGNISLDGTLSAATVTAGNIDCGTDQITGLTNDSRVTSGAISFHKTFSSAPNVIVSLLEAMPENCAISVEPSTVTTEHFHVIGHRLGATTTIDFSWIAIL